jgi:hypothetical protein
METMDQRETATMADSSNTRAPKATKAQAGARGEKTQTIQDISWRQPSAAGTTQPCLQSRRRQTEKRTDLGGGPYNRRLKTPGGFIESATAEAESVQV